MSGINRPNHGYTVQTSFNKDLICVETFFEQPGFEVSRDRLYRQIVNLQEQGVRNALIALGWTPPPEKVDG